MIFTFTYNVFALVVANFLTNKIFACMYIYIHIFIYLYIYIFMYRHVTYVCANDDVHR
jgi:hypothetical protein